MIPSVATESLSGAAAGDTTARRDEAILHSAAWDPSLMPDIGRIRYAAYSGVGAIPLASTKEFLDEYDDAPNVTSYLLRKDGSDIASIRVNVYGAEYQWQETTAFEVYRTEILAHCGRTTIVESNRFVVAPEHQNKGLAPLNALFRAITLAIMKFDAEWVITAVRPEHALFYRRALCMNPISGAKPYPRIDAGMILLAGDIRRDFDKVLSRRPSLRITQEDLTFHDQCGLIRCW